MAVDEVVVDPVALVRGNAALIELTHTDDDIPGLTVHLVTVDIERVGELVEATNLLVLLERLRYDGWIDQPYAGRRISVIAQLAYGRRRLSVVLRDVRVP